jgi:3-hydroxyisobutyrate dehydrogenase
VSPKQKQSIAAAVAPSRARVVDGAVMGSAPENGLNVSILLSGHGAAEVSGILSGLGFNCRAVGVQVGEAAAIKMVRSVFAKGLEALFVEMLLAGKKYGVQEQVIQSVCESLENKSIRSVMNTLVVSLANHSARKKTEMDYVAEVLLDVGVQPEMTNGTRRVLEWITSMDIKQELPADGFDYHDIINAIENRSAK